MGGTNPSWEAFKNYRSGVVFVNRNDLDWLRENIENLAVNQALIYLQAYHDFCRRYGIKIASDIAAGLEKGNAATE